MNRMLLIIWVWILAFAPLTAHAVPVVADLSNYRIFIDSGFNGTRVFLFGTRNDTGDIVIAVRGPQKDYIVRKKEQVAGIWVNGDRMKFFNVPNFYALASSRPLDEIEQANIFRQLGIGMTNLLVPPPNPKWHEKFNEFSQAFLNYQKDHKLYSTDPDNIQFMAETLFKAIIYFPDNIPAGDYTAEIYLLSDGEISGMQSIPIKIVKSGLDAFLYEHAHRRPILYGITAVVLALSIGWFTGRLFEKI